MICGPFGFVVATAFTYCLAEVRVVDGDTLHAFGRYFRFHIAAAPERKAVGGPEATANLSGLVDGRMVLCEEASTPSLGREVATCYRMNGKVRQDLGCLQIADGHARTDPRYDDGRYAGCKPEVP